MISQLHLADLETQFVASSVSTQEGAPTDSDHEKCIKRCRMLLRRRCLQNVDKI